MGVGVGAWLLFFSSGCLRLLFTPSPDFPGDFSVWCILFCVGSLGCAFNADLPLTSSHPPLPPPCGTLHQRPLQANPHHETSTPDLLCALAPPTPTPLKFTAHLHLHSSYAQALRPTSAHSENIHTTCITHFVSTGRTTHHPSQPPPTCPQTRI